MNNLLRQEKRKAALSVNDMGSINVDADRICREFLSELKKAGRYRRLCPLSIRLGWSCRSLSTSICIRTALRETGAGAFDLLTQTSYYVSISLHMDLAEIDKDGKGLQFFGKTKVERLEKIEGQPNVFLLQTTIECERSDQLAPKSGQFYLIRSAKSAVNYNRPISVYHSEEWINNEGKKKILVQFLMLEKGRGTQELYHMTLWDDISVIGPLGKPWPMEECRAVAKKNPGKAKICIIGGGIGVAPVANLAHCLPDFSYDFYAAFKSGSYGLERIRAHKLTVTTDDGSCGIQGMLPCALSKETVKEAGYELILACGPTPALVYVQGLAKELGIKCYISMEHRMLCGLGACLGCTLETTDGLKRCCKDGPVLRREKSFSKSLCPAARRWKKMRNLI